MSQEKKFHANPAMIRQLYQKFGPKSEDFHFDYDDFQFQFMKFTVIERIVDSLIQKIRNVHNFTVIADENEFLSDFVEPFDLKTYYSKCENRQVAKVVDFLNDICNKREEFYSSHQNVKFLIYLQKTFLDSCKSLKKALNDRIELGLYYHDKFTFFDKLIKSIQQQLTKAEDLSNEFEQIISINKASIQTGDSNEENAEEEEEDSNEEPLIKKFVTELKNSLSITQNIFDENDEQ